MNRKICVGASYVLCFTVAAFFVLQVISVFMQTELLAMLSYGVCIPLSWSYLAVAAGHSALADDDRKIPAELGKMFAVMYSVFICIVYFSQLSVVHYAVLSEEIVTAFAFGSNGSWLFVIDIVGYGFMAISTLFVGLTIKPENKGDKVLKIIMLIHGMFCVCTVLPITPLFIGNGSNSSAGGAAALAVWCVIFFPIALLSAKRFSKAEF